MDLRRLRVGEFVVGAAGTALLVSLFLDWYAGVSGWQAFAVTDVVVAVVSLAALALPVTVAVQRTAAVGIAYEALLTIASTVALIFVAVRVAKVPGGLVDRQAGLWLGLVAALVLVAGCLVAMRDERRSKPGKPTDATGVPVPPPEIETLHAP